jgi:DNA-binding LacI/PurR family transcriptional regulator
MKEVTQEGSAARGGAGETLSPKPGRVSLKDIALDLGISPTAASFAINDKPGVSEETKKKVKEAAVRLGWSPVYAAQALSSSRTMTIGFAPLQVRTNFQNESFMLHFMAGIHTSLSTHRYGLLFRPSVSPSEELAIYKDWARRKRVDGVILTDLRENDPRPKLLKDLGVPTVLAGGPDPGDHVPSLSIDDSGSMATILQHLTEMGHRRIAYLSGAKQIDYGRIRAKVFQDFAEKYPLESASIHYTKFDAGIAGTLTSSLLSGPNPPTALIYENEIMAASSLHTLEKLRFTDSSYAGSGIQAASMDQGAPWRNLPAIVSFEDSFICTTTFPTITAMQRDAMEYGRKVASLLLKILNNEKVVGNRSILPPRLIVRESTAMMQPRS